MLTLAIGQCLAAVRPLPAAHHLVASNGRFQIRRTGAPRPNEALQPTSAIVRPTEQFIFARNPPGDLDLLINYQSGRCHDRIATVSTQMTRAELRNRGIAFCYLYQLDWTGITDKIVTGYLLTVLPCPLPLSPLPPSLVSGNPPRHAARKRSRPSSSWPARIAPKASPHKQLHHESA